MRFEVFTNVTILMMYIFPEDGDSTLLRNVGFYQPVHAAPKPRRTSTIVNLFSVKIFVIFTVLPGIIRVRGWD
jgi:hypothetical protein